MSWLYALIGLALGGLAGYLLARRFGDSEQRATALEKELERSREEHAAYRREVSDHFAKTAVAVNQLTDSYRNVHQQLSDGARALCDNAAAETALAFDQARLIDAPDVEAPSADPDATTTDTPPATDVRSPDGPAAEAGDHAATLDDASAEHPDPGTNVEAVPETKPEPEREPAPASGTPRADSEDEARPEQSARGGASWTPASSADASESLRPPRDYAEEEAGAKRG